MQEHEHVKVWIKVVKGETVCICHRSRKACNSKCEKDVVDRDRFAGWQDLMHRDRYGK